MSGTLNKVMLIGHTGDEVKMHYFDDRNCVGRFPLATNETYTNKQTNERVTNTEWHNVVLWTPLAEIAERFLHKGSQVYIEGKITNRSYEDKDGNTRYVTEIVGREMTLLGSRNEERSPSPVAAQTNRPVVGQPVQQTQSTAPAEEYMDDLPF